MSLSPLEAAASKVRKSLQQAAAALGVMQQRQRFQADAADYVRDPRYAVPVARHGNATPPLVRETVKASFGANDHGKRLKDHLDRWKDAGDISEEAYNAGRLFAMEFERCGFDRCRTTNLDGSRGGNITIEDILTRNAHARGYVHSVIRLLGGPTSSMTQALVHFLGTGMDIKTITAQMSKGSRPYWTGVVQSALEVMGADYASMMRGQQRHAGIVGQTSNDLVVPSQSYVIEKDSS